MNVRVLLALGLLPALAFAQVAETAAKEDPEPGSPEAVELAVKIVVQADQAAREGRVARALDIARRVAHLAPAAPGAQRMLGDLYYTVGDCAHAIHHYQTYARIARPGDDVSRAQGRAEECRSAGRRQGRLEVTVLPQEAAVRVLAPWQEAPVAAGQGGLEARLPTGEYRIQATLPGHAKLDAEVRVLPAKTAKVVETLGLRPATLKVDSVPPGARIKIDGGAVGEAPVRVEPISVGDHVVEAELEGFEPARTITRIQAGQDVAITLRPEPAPARFHVSTDAPETRVELDGTVRCRAPCDIEVPADGEHRLRLLSPGYVTVEQLLRPAPGETGELELSLQETAGKRVERSRTRWAIGLGATGAALAIGGAVALGSGFSTASEADDTYARYQDASGADDALSLYARAGDLDERARNEQIIGYGLLGAAVVTGITATVLWATAESSAYEADQEAGR